MQKNKMIGSGITALKITVELNDAIAIAMLLDKLDEYEDRVEKYNEWQAKRDEIHEEDAWYQYAKDNPKPEDPNREGAWSPMEFIEKAKNILRQLTFVNISESNVFDEDWMKSDGDKAHARKSYD